MSTWGDKLLRDGRPDVGIGISVAPADVPDAQILEYPDFSAGLIIGANKGSAPPNAAIEVLHMEPSRSGRMVSSPGIQLSSTNAGRDLKNFFNQGGLDYLGRLIFIQPPNTGVMSLLGGAPVFTNNGIAAVSNEALQYNAVNYGDDLIFSNGTAATYRRVAATGVVTDISANIVARTFMSLFGRLFAGAYTDGTYQALGVRWNGSSASPTDWTGADSGAELLIADVGIADELVAMRAIGQDVGAILMRNSLWAAYKTNEVNRPADFKLRFVGYGCVSELTAAVTAGGVTFLSDAGVVLYNINDAQIISQDINEELLPLDQTKLSFGRYRATYDALRQRYLLSDGTYIYVYEFPREGVPGRWTRRDAATTTGLGVFRPDPSIQLSVPVPIFVEGSGKIGYESYSQSTAYGLLPYAPYWVIPANPAFAYDRFVQTIGLQITYRSPNNSFTMTVSTKDQNDALLESENIGINQDTSARGTDRFYPITLRGVGSSLKFATNSLIPGFEILRVRQFVLDGGPIQPSG